MDEKLYLTTAEVADFLQITVQAVYKARFRGTLKAAKKGNHNVTLYATTEVARYQKENAGRVGYRPPILEEII